MTTGIAIVGMACRYPDARSPAELWENVLAGRRAFRRMPSERLRAEDYYSADRDAPDRTYCTQAALIENYEFDRARFNISGATYRATDLAHWLALDIAERALADAGLTAGLPRESTAVYVGNTLTGEFSRASTLRLRWPYTKRVIAAALEEEGWEPAKLDQFLERLEQTYKEPFAPVGEDTLAGGLSNTIAGRISNYFDLKGGGYTVDGACASSLLAVTTACSALAAGDIQVALAGGVDLSLDPFELVGFAKTRALAGDEMRVFDAHSDGFWPGEGCGFVVLMRRADALARGLQTYAVIRGWGVSSDGSGGISRPEPAGQLLAIRRAYCRAGFAPSSAAYVEGHGTGTSVGDATELRALSQARREADPTAPAAAIGSIKANIGHTKAAAGVAGLIKAAMAVHTQTLPPTTGCETPHAELTCDAPGTARARAWRAMAGERAIAGLRQRHGIWRYQHARGYRRRVMRAARIIGSRARAALIRAGCRVVSLHIARSDFGFGAHRRAALTRRIDGCRRGSGPRAAGILACRRHRLHAARVVRAPPRPARRRLNPPARFPTAHRIPFSRPRFAAAAAWSAGGHRKSFHRRAR